MSNRDIQLAAIDTFFTFLIEANRAIREWLTTTAKSWQGVYIVGPYFYGFFMWANAWMLAFYWKIYTWWGIWNWAAEELGRILSFEEIRDGLLAVWNELKGIQANPIAWIDGKVPRAYSWSPGVATNVYAWIYWWLNREFKLLWNLWYYPGTTIRDLIRTYLPDVYTLYLSPRAFIDNLVPRAYSWSPGIASNVSRWIYWWLHREFKLLWSLWYYPGLTTRDLIQTYLGKLWEFYVTPFATIRDYLRTRYGWKFDAFDDPKTYLREVVLRNYPGIYPLLDTPMTFVWCKVKDYLHGYAEAEAAFLLGIAERILVKIW